ncbi:MAG TPA: PLP-dependent aminotransferase family protein [Micromonosporaceae bacterium]|jgi:DNA-binding transcriptional MocR family regulator|nr:PLP-dependent aminotransferase family protein [Micromonosporaceae bacterium]
MTAEQLISFARGAPSIDIIDVAGLKAAAARAFDADPVGLTGYGTSVGYPPLREWIADKHGVDVDNVIVTNGSLEADAFVFQHFVKPGDAVIVEKPTYDRTLANLLALGADVYQINLDADGIDVDDVRALLESGVRPTLAHIIPNFQNPAGVTLSAARRSALVALAAEYGFMIFEDDPYADIRFRGERLPTMLSLDAHGRDANGRDANGREVNGNVVHASSFTKTVCPGVRVGYLVGPKPLIATIAKRATSLYISPVMVTEAIVYQFCVSGDIDASIKTVCAALGERASTLAASLRKHIPGVRFTEPNGGYFLWVELPDDVDVARVVPAAAERGVAVVMGSDFLLEGGRHALRLAYSAVTVNKIDEGVRRLAAAIEETRAAN